ncbi:MAG: gliding motility protein GldN [Bacteroidaceae bacterium]|jgi:gliding motility associated protien GldN|nr:gliding motility protein GldN [Bacteroidaceae bacterium]OPZ47457.1 MAG: hypothetical protein BWY95_01467 [Bacteroidetes bacterium ADurb.BinA104]MBP8602458.1 gliding motility protein GldN [Bacteroidaceae bacterium]HOD68053.1 gliding motility protein GldN [Bacteroidaceae bacterium]HPB03717.1 gliding motility protein GldN [Bacteroidaceae bacterium]
MKKSILIFLTLSAVLTANAQPARRLQEQAAQAAENRSPAGVALTERARYQYTAQTSMPAEVIWKRDIYRELDLRKEKNAALYYPEDPMGDRVNFFTLLLNLILDGKIKAYEYRLDGNEYFAQENVLDIENMLDKFYIYYRKENDKYIIEPADIPSREIEKYYIKESNYIDHLSNYQTKVTAICPVLMRSDFGEKPTAYPMFWLDYDEISPYLGQTRVMTSSFNNTTNMSLDDYFVMHQYEGEIYKTSNLRNQPLSDYCETDSAMEAERIHIEKQLTDFENGLWSRTIADSHTDNTEAATEEKSVKERRLRTLRPERTPKNTTQDGERLSIRR